MGAGSGLDGEPKLVLVHLRRTFEPPHDVFGKRPRGILPGAFTVRCKTDAGT
ncbi:hypothetical protein SmB9_15000 [Sphingosinicella microcystinivorans]|uniref:Uncharacterized protein n=1 Tax=Sphingosinicella microcystinivorans TaxID=335406 RepID=A0AAD1D5N4_SPHMI|nr:hypothetical protein SmB9_15000 [Sphingosinicella microcystinivorans]